MAEAAALTLPAEIDREAARRRLAILLLVGVTGVGAILRLWALGSVGLNSDEAVYSGQAASLAGHPVYQQFFAIFRAHPLLVQFLISLVFQFGVNDLHARLLAVGFGLAAIPLTYALGTHLYSRRVGLIAAALIAVMPYHVSVSRQILLDAPMMTLFLLTVYFFARYASSGLAHWLYLAAFAGGLTFLAKETAVLVVAVGGAFALMTATVQIGLRRILIAGAIFLLAISPYPISIAISGASETARAFLIWQLLRRPNHTWTFYPEILPGAVGPLVLLVAILGLIAAIRIAGWQERLLLAWVAVPVVFFQIWPVKGYQYLLPIAPALAILAGRAMELPWSEWLDRRTRGWAPRFADAAPVRLAAAALPLVLVASIAAPSVVAVTTTTTLGSLAGTGGLPGGREAGQWIRENVPQGAGFMTIGPTMSNIVQFYGQRRSQGLSVSPNPLRRNPAYDPILNPDRSVQTLRIQYIAYDVWSAARSPWFAGVLQRYIDKYHGRLVYEQKALTRDLDGIAREQVVIRIYEVRP